MTRQHMGNVMIQVICLVFSSNKKQCIKLEIYLLISITTKISLKKTAGIVLPSKLQGHKFPVPKKETEESISKYKSQLAK